MHFRIFYAETKTISDNVDSEPLLTLENHSKDTQMPLIPTQKQNPPSNANPTMLESLKRWHSKDESTE